MSLSSKEYENYLAHDRAMVSRLARSLHEWFAEMSGKTVVDMGCGSGDTGALLVKRFRVIGVDEQASALENAHKLGLGTVRASLEEKIPLATSSADNVICKDVFEHLVHPHHLRGEIHRILKKGGRLYAHVPNQFTLLDRVQMLFGRSMVVSRWFPGTTEWNFPHLRFFTRSGFRKFLEEGGFAIEREYEDIFYYHLPFGLTTRFLSKISPELFAPGFTFTCVKK